LHTSRFSSLHFFQLYFLIFDYFLDYDFRRWLRLFQTLLPGFRFHCRVFGISFRDAAPPFIFIVILILQAAFAADSRFSGFRFRQMHFAARHFGWLPLSLRLPLRHASFEI
jgi:hypothetical protein